MAVIVVYGGGFQPFHVGHLSSYLQAKKAFPEAAFYVAASNDTKTRPIPFNDKQFLAQQAGVVDPFVEVKLPIRPQEILDKYNPEKDIFILVRSERDPVGYTKKDGSPGYYQPFQNLESCAPFATHGYIFVTKKQTFKLNGEEVYSGTQVRDMYANSDDQGRINIISQLYPKSKQQKMIKKLLDKYLSNTQPINLPKPNAIKKLKQKQLAETISKIRPLLSEASIEKKFKLLKLMKSAISESQGVAEEQVNELRDETIQSYLSKADRQISNRLDRMSQARERLNKNYEIYDVENPSRIIDRFEANSPELAREYYYKFIKEFNPGDQNFHFEVRRSTGIMEDKEPKITDVVIDFYKPVVDNIEKEKVDNYVEQARELLHKAPDNTVREKLLDIFKKGKTNPYLQGGIITTVGALLAGGVLSSSQNLGLNPAQTNLALQAILNTVIPTIVSRVNGKNWIDTIKYTLASAGVGTGIAGAGLLEDSQDYLEEK
jgi:phosphopantetheine adenylyltransferase